MIAATLAGGYLALVSFRQDRELSVGGIRLSVSPGHTGSLDVYVPLVDWGARFESIRLPVRLRVDVRTVDRDALQRVADGGALDVGDVRAEARDAIAAYLRALIGVVALCALALGLLTAFAVRHRVGPRLRYTVAAAVDHHARDRPSRSSCCCRRAGRSTRRSTTPTAPTSRARSTRSPSVRRSGRALDQELDAQLVGLARLVDERRPTARRSRGGRGSRSPRTCTTTSSRCRSSSAPPATGRCSSPATCRDRGSPLETALVRRVAEIGKPFVFVTGNHDSDRSAQELADDGAVVLTQFGRLKRGRRLRPGDQRDRGPARRRLLRPVRAPRGGGLPRPLRARADATRSRTRSRSGCGRSLGKVDVVMVHEPALIAQTLAELEVVPPQEPLVFVVGHTHEPALTRQPNVTVINGGSIGGGGTGNLADDATDVGLARLSYADRRRSRRSPPTSSAIDPGTGAATARRERLDEPESGVASMGWRHSDSSPTRSSRACAGCCTRTRPGWRSRRRSCSSRSRRPRRARVAALIYGAGLIALFSASALYHRWPGDPRWKPWLRRLDHSTIFVFIAASYTPIGLLVLDGTLQTVVLVSVWAGARGRRDPEPRLDQRAALAAGRLLPRGRLGRGRSRCRSSPTASASRRSCCSRSAARCTRSARPSTRSSGRTCGRARTASTRSSTRS